MEHVSWARELAERLLGEPLPRRWAHSQGVGRKAEAIAHLAGDDAELLICSAWLHDTGYAPTVADTGLHSLDGARYLRDIESADPRLCSLVAYHSCAIIEAGRRGHGDALVEEFEHPSELLADALTYCDMTTSPDGKPVDAAARLDEILIRYPIGSVVAQSIQDASQHIVNAEKRILHLLSTQTTMDDKRP